MTEEAIIVDAEIPLAATPDAAPGSGGSASHILLAPATGDTTAPQIGNFDPAAGTPLERNTPVVFEVTDETALRRVAVFVVHSNQTLVVHDGDGFRGEFANYSSRVAIPGGWRYSVRRNGGWLSAIRFEIIAIDTSGNEAL
jgi:hypothetical protein